MIQTIRGLLDKIVDLPILTKIENAVLDRLELAKQEPEQPKEEPKEAPASTTVESV
jgi:hypothetical protein